MLVEGFEAATFQPLRTHASLLKRIKKKRQKQMTAARNRNRDLPTEYIPYQYINRLSHSTFHMLSSQTDLHVKVRP